MIKLCVSPWIKCVIFDENEGFCMHTVSVSQKSEKCATLGSHQSLKSTFFEIFSMAATAEELVEWRKF